MDVLEKDPVVPDGPPENLSRSVTGLAYLAARQGALLLDRLDPGWEASVEPDRIDQDTDPFNVLALRYGSPEAGARFLLEALCDPGAREPGERGHPSRVEDFLHGCGFSSSDLWVDKDQRELAADYLNFYWRREARARKDGTSALDARTPDELVYVASVRVAVRVPSGGYWKPFEARAADLLEAVLDGEDAVAAWRFSSSLSDLPELVLSEPEEAVGRPTSDERSPARVDDWLGGTPD